MKKRIISGILAITLCLGSFSACDLFAESSQESSAPTFTPPITSNPPSEDIITDTLSIHFLYLGNAVSGDCTLIKVGDTEVLIDAGSITSSAETIVPYVQKYCTDGVLDYVIATHAHEDHIAAFVGTSNAKGIFDSFECKTIIDYVGKKTTSQISQEYEAKRDKEVQNGGVHYTALECWKEENGASRSYDLGEGITLNILYQKYYEESTSNENNYSVCTLLSQGDNHYLFTGDLEKAGEKSLVESNTLPQCVLYKGGHHGSNTASSMDLLNVIKPSMVCVCSCCGDKFDFPHQEFIDNVSEFTDKVYITTVKSGGKGVPLNGNIVVHWSEGKAISVTCSNNNTLFKDTDWFKANRTMPEKWKTPTTGA